MKKLAVPQEKNIKVLHPVVANLVANVAGEVPGLGAIVETWRDSIADRKEEKLWLFLIEVADAVNELAKQNSEILDQLHLQSDYFSSSLANVAQLAMNSADSTKRDYLKQYMINYSKVTRPDVDLAWIYENFLANFSGSHIVVLEKIANAQAGLNQKELTVLTSQPTRREAITVGQCGRDLKIESNVIEALVASLEANGLISQHDRGTGLGEGGSVLIIRPLGRSFIQYVSK
jgi:hypothetical protein